jgi:hypothetical protein
MYLWSLLGNDLLGRPVQHGITDDVAKAMRAAESHLKNGRAFVCVIEEVRLRMNVTGLDENYAATGKRWNGRRNTGDGVHWQLIAGAPGPARIYRVPESLYQGDLRSLVAFMSAALLSMFLRHGLDEHGLDEHGLNRARRWSASGPCATIDACDFGSSQSHSREPAMPRSVASPRRQKTSASTRFSGPITT